MGLALERINTACPFYPARQRSHHYLDKARPPGPQYLKTPLCFSLSQVLSLFQPHLPCLVHRPGVITTPLLPFTPRLGPEINPSSPDVLKAGPSSPPRSIQVITSSQVARRLLAPTITGYPCLSRQKLYPTTLVPPNDRPPSIAVRHELPHPHVWISLTSTCPTEVGRLD